MKRISLVLKLALLLFAMMGGGAALAVGLLVRLKSPGYALLVTAGAALALALLAAHRAIRPVRRVLRAMQTSVACYTDGDFSVSLVVDRDDELGDLLRTNNELGSALRKQRVHLVQRELLLDTVSQNSPVALLLVDAHQRVVYANFAARHLLNEGRSLLGGDFAAILRVAPPALREAIATGGDSLFSTPIAGIEETFSLSQRGFMLQGQRHRLFLLKTLTRELSRQEVATWKKLIRVVSHELNNSLGPITSMADTGREVLRRGDTSTLVDVFAAIRERAAHLHQFVAGYAAIARLPTPIPDRVSWGDLMEDLSRQQAFRIAEALPAEPGWFDRLQLEQALINVLKNAHEAGGRPEPGEYSHQAIRPRAAHRSARSRSRHDRSGARAGAIAVLFHQARRHRSGARPGAGDRRSAWREPAAEQPRRRWA